MARQTTKTIPTKFVKLDTNVTDADEYVNVRDLQVARENHNILIARGLRRTILASTRVGVGNARWIIRGGNIGDERLGAQRQIFSAEVIIGQHVQSVTMVLDGVVSGTGLDIKFTGVIDRPFSIRNADAGVTATASQGGSAKTTIANIPVPHFSPIVRLGGDQVSILSLYMQPEIGSNAASGLTINAVGSNGESVDVDTVSLSGQTEGQVMHFNTTTIPPRICSRRIDSGGTPPLPVGESRLFVEKPFAPAPTTSNTLSLDTVATYTPLAVTAYEDHITTFDASRAGI